MLVLSKSRYVSLKVVIVLVMKQNNPFCSLVSIQLQQRQHCHLAAVIRTKENAI